MMPAALAFSRGKIERNLRNICIREILKKSLKNKYLILRSNKSFREISYSTQAYVSFFFKFRQLPIQNQTFLHGRMKSLAVRSTSNAVCQSSNQSQAEVSTGWA
jgi:hypothetical protein